MADSRYQIYLFDSKNRRISSLSKSKSFEIYFDNKYIDGYYYPVSWKAEKKKLFIDKIIIEHETKRLLKVLKNKRPTRFRQVSIGLTSRWDFKLTNSQNKIIPSSQFSKAHGFRLYLKNEVTNRFRYHSAWDFASPNLKSEFKKEQIVTASKDAEVKSVLPLEIDIDRIEEEPTFPELIAEDESRLPNYEIRLSRSQDFLAFKSDPSFAKFRKIVFKEPYPAEIIMKEMSERQKDEIRLIFKKEWKKEWMRSGDSRHLFNLRIMFQYYDDEGNLMTQIGDDGFPVPIIQAASTSRWSIGNMNDGDILFDDMIDAIEKYFAGYLQSNSGNVGVISQIMIESLYAR